VAECNGLGIVITLNMIESEMGYRGSKLGEEEGDESDLPGIAQEKSNE